MTHQRMLVRWKKQIIKECRSRLHRDLRAEEEHFINSRNTFISLEMIEDTVKTSEPPALEEYLNSESTIDLEPVEK
jgi:hypothetical protein